MRQEKRLRLAFLTVLADSASILFVKCIPEFHNAEVRLPPPCDDAAWHAPDAAHCASALGLNGSNYQQHFNLTGSLKLRQLNFDYAYYALQVSSTSGLQPRDTNIHGKVILIHALHMDVWRLQKQRSFLQFSSSPHGDPSALNVRTQQNFLLLAFRSDGSSVGISTCDYNFYHI